MPGFSWALLRSLCQLIFFYKNEEAPSNSGALRCPVVPNKKSLFILISVHYKILKNCKTEAQVGSIGTHSYQWFLWFFCFGNHKICI